MFLVTAQVDGGHGVLRPVTASTAWSRQNAERASQQMSGSAHAALTNKFADVAAGHGFATQLHLRIFLHLKPHLPAQSDKFAHVPRCLVTKAEIESLVHLARVQMLFQNVVSELVWCQQREIAREGQQQHGIEPGGFEQANSFWSRRKQR